MNQVAHDWRGCSAAQIEVVARTLIDFARRASGQVPAPRGLPFFALDHPAGELSPYESLAAHGIFRKYESVLLIGAGLGGAARWCHVHFGCDVTGLTDPAAAVAAAQLSARAGLGGHTRFLAAEPDHLPLRAGAFTHAWMVEGMADVDGADVRLREAFRAVRLGGLVAVQQSHAARGWEDRAAAAMRSAGFVEVRVRRVERPPLREALRRARGRFLAALRQAEDPLAEAAAAAVERVYGQSSAEGGTVTQVFARRPS